jgi:hypothetical protein
MRTNRPISLLAYGVILTILASCLLEKEAKRGSVIENEIAGTLYLEDGSPAMGAAVRLYPVNQVPRHGLVKQAASDSDAVFASTTDGAGRYRVTDLPAGEYNIMAELGLVSSLLDSVVISEATDSLPSDTLTAPGTVVGRVILEPDADPRSCFVQVLGTNRFAGTDSTGQFILRDLPAGKYSTRVVATLPDYNPYFGSFQVRSGKQDTLEPIRMPFVGVPLVLGLKVAYDTVNSLAKITWRPSAYRFLKEYLVFRNDASDLRLPADPIARVTDTSFVDDLGDFADVDGKPRQFEYRVRIRNLSDRDGTPFGSVVVEATPKHLVATTMSIKALGTFGARGSVRDTLTLVLSWSNPRRGHDSLVWTAEPDGDTLSVRKVEGQEGVDTLRIVLPATAGSLEVHAALRDIAGTWRTDSMRVTAVQDVPKALAGQDTTVTPNDNVFLHGKASEVFGSIVRWEWDFGNRGSFAPFPTGEAATRSSALPGQEFHVLRVTDDDGNIGLDTVRVTVIADLPVADAGRDTQVTLSDRVVLRGKGLDGLGTLVKQEWDIGAKGYFIPTSTGDTQVVSRPDLGFDYHVFRVTDDDGNIAIDTVRVTVRNDFPVVSLTAYQRGVAYGGGYFLKAKATDAGQIVKWEWDVENTGTFVLGSGPDTAFVPTQPGGTIIDCKVRATDEDGNATVAKFSLRVSKWAEEGELPVPLPTTNYSLSEMGGKLYATGTTNESGAGTLTLWSYDPATYSHSRLDNPPFQGKTILHSIGGRLHAFQGNSPFVMEYVPALKEWSWRWNLHSAMVPIALDGKLYVAYREGTDPKIGILDTLTGTIAMTGYLKSDLSPARITGAAGIGGKLYFLTWYPYTVLYEYNPVNNEWNENQLVGALGVINSWSTMVELEGKLYIVSEKSFHEFDPATRILKEKSNPLRPSWGRSMVVYNGKIFCLSREGVLQSYRPSDDP